jgi:hypothetical protein
MRFTRPVSKWFGFGFINDPGVYVALDLGLISISWYQAPRFNLAILIMTSLVCLEVNRRNPIESTI